MTTLPFRPPHFSDDAAWLPPWLQPYQSSPASAPTASSQFCSRQILDPLEGGKNQVKEPTLLLSRESRYNICRLHLSGEDSSAVTLTASCEKVLHFNLHLSTDGTSSIISTRISDTPQDDKLNSATDKEIQPHEALLGPRETSQSNMDINSTDINLSLPLSENSFGKVYTRTPNRTKDSVLDNSEIHGSKGTDCDGINDAVELSVAASEALIIHELVGSGSMSETVSAAAILELALRVKQARVDGLKGSLYSSKDGGDTSYSLSDLGDSDMEDAYMDVGLSVFSQDNIPSMEPSVSRVKDTPMTYNHPEEEREVESEWNKDQEMYVNNSFSIKPLQDHLVTNISEAFPSVPSGIDKQENLCGNLTSDLIFGNAYQPELGNSEDFQMNQGETIERVCVDHFPHEEVKSSLQALHSREADMNKGNNKSSQRFHSRWLDGWTGKGVKSIPKWFSSEASYLSESADLAPDQNSIVHHHPCSSKASEVTKPSNDSNQTAAKVSVSQDFVKDSTSTFADPLCSVVPCSISSEMVGFSMATENNNHLTVCDTVQNIKVGIESLLETIETNYSQNDENVDEEHTELVQDDVGTSPVIRQRFTSLKAYSLGLPGNSAPSLKRSVDYALVRGEGNGLLSGSCTNSPNDKDLVKSPVVESKSGCATAIVNQQKEDMRVLSVEQHIDCSDTSDGGVPKELGRPMSSTTAANSIYNHVADSFGRPIQDHCRSIPKDAAELHVHLQDAQTSPLVLCPRKRRSRAPRLPTTVLSTTYQVEDQHPEFNTICLNSRENQGQLQNLPENDVSARKRVRFSDADIQLRPKKILKTMATNKIRSSSRLRDQRARFDPEQGITSQEVKECLTNCRMGRKRAIFQGLDFLLTGFSRNKEKEIEVLLRKHGGVVLSDIPVPLCRPRERRSLSSSAERLPVVLCAKKLQTTRFLYGCAVNAFLLKVGWAYDSIKAGSVLLPDKYEILSNRKKRMMSRVGKSISRTNHDYIFDRVGIMLHGTHRFCTKFAEVIKHGGGLVYKSPHWLIQSLKKKKIYLGAIVVEDENRATRHLKKCASEEHITIVSSCWILNSLFKGKLLPLKGNYNSSNTPANKIPEISAVQDWSQEI